ncbi:MAG: PAS domain-containing protein [Verrucomicrobiales bacterium]|nr:PAS domain-containing protein [Verrucomicrobiales bacterium]HQZ26728.1 PAS domain-containing protein [Verrucomicrobiales bacterium]
MSHHHHRTPGSAFEPSPEPDDVLPRWWRGIQKTFSQDPEDRWGPQMFRIASDMMVVCTDTLEICHHNRAFLKGIGYASGCFSGRFLFDFFPQEDRASAIDAFAGLKSGHAAGMRISATFLTLRGRRQMDARAVRSRNQDGSFVYYLVLRDVTEQLKATELVQARSAENLFGSLPVAVWKTDSQLKVTETTGALWSELGYSRERLIGGDLSDPHSVRLPSFFLDLDYCDTMAGMSFQTEVSVENQPYSITVEPILDTSNRVVGTIGILRRSKIPVLSPHGTPERLTSLGTGAIAGKKTRKVSLEPFGNSPCPASTPRPRTLAPPTRPVSTFPRKSFLDQESVALSN